MEHLKKIGENNYIGTLIVNKDFEVIQMNFKLKTYFGMELSETEKFFGNIFKCSNVVSDKGLHTHKISEPTQCGSTAQCENCNIRRCFTNALNDQLVLKSHLINKFFIINGIRVMKWFEMIFDTLKTSEEVYVCIYIIDVSEIMNFKMDEETLMLISEEGISQQQLAFKDAFINHFLTPVFSAEPLGIVVINIQKDDSISYAISNIRKEMKTINIYKHLLASITEKSNLCRINPDEFLIWYTENEKNSLVELLKALTQQQPKLSGDLLKLSVQFVQIMGIRKCNRSESHEAYKLYLEAYYHGILKNVHTLPLEELLSIEV